jgi:hypothetical protein
LTIVLHVARSFARTGNEEPWHNRKEQIKGSVYPDITIASLLTSI